VHFTKSQSQQTRRTGACNTGKALTTVAYEGGTPWLNSNEHHFPSRIHSPITQVALYARVSTLNNQDPEMQLSELREYAGRRGWQIVEEFTDQGVSGPSLLSFTGSLRAFRNGCSQNLPRNDE
jgi:hypothetical protein